ncbi:hypothetical protein BJY52DRAFT_1268674 [Lactarius psammicola]|nr:hypothetical protein BJY52DRAFT_1268674 [Lactarius psammicola]
MRLKLSPTQPASLSSPLASGECGFLLCFYPLILLLLFSITVSFCSFTPSFALIPRSIIFHLLTRSVDMSRFTTPRSCFLDPLEEFPLVVPFPEAPLLPSGPGALGLFHETPSTIDMSLPTPRIPVFTVLNYELPPPAQVHYETPIPQSEAIQPPPAPLVKDMDSFSEGTAQGSFDFTMCSDPGDAQAPPSVAFSPGHPALSIEIWRDDVVRSTAAGREEQHPLSGEDRHISEPATKRRRLSFLPMPEERPVTASAVGRSQSLPPINLCLIQDNDDHNRSVAVPLTAVPRHPSTPASV